MRAKDRDLMWLRCHLKSKARYHLGLALEKEKGKCHPQNEPTFPEASQVMGAHWRAGGTCLLHKWFFIAALNLAWENSQEFI